MPKTGQYKKRRKYLLKWSAEHREQQREKCRNYQAGIKDIAYKKLGNKCSNPACQWLNADGSRGCTDRRCLQVDHVFGGGGKEHKKLKCPREIYRKVLKDEEGNYQLLCANCNWIKRFINGENTRFIKGNI